MADSARWLQEPQRRKPAVSSFQTRPGQEVFATRWLQGPRGEPAVGCPQKQPGEKGPAASGDARAEELKLR